MAADGLPVIYGGSLAGLSANQPQGVRSFELGRGFVIQNAQLTVLVGTRVRNSDAAGFMQIAIQ